MSKLALAFSSLLILVASGPVHARERQSGDRLLRRGLPPVTEKERGLKEVPFAPGAAAVILLEAERNEWNGFETLRVDYFRRIKILNAAGAERYGDFEYDLFGGWRVQKVDVRTHRPDGSVVEAKEGIHKEASRDGSFQVIRVAFPEVEPGAILDLHVSLHAEAWALDPWVIQHRLPVLESRFILIPPADLKYNTAVFGIEGKAAEPRQLSTPGGKAFVWSFRDLPPLADEPNAPPLSQVAPRLVTVLDSYRSHSQYIPLASTWRVLSENRQEFWRDWRQAGHGASDELAKQLAEGLSDPLEKAEVARAALAERIHLEYYAAWPAPPRRRGGPPSSAASGCGCPERS